MTFPEAFILLRQGERVTRQLWCDLDGGVGSWLELVNIPLADGRPFARPVFLIWREKEPAGFSPWAGAQVDILADDWKHVI